MAQLQNGCEGLVPLELTPLALTSASGTIEPVSSTRLDELGVVEAALHMDDSPRGYQRWSDLPRFFLTSMSRRPPRPCHRPGSRRAPTVRDALSAHPEWVDFGRSMYRARDKQQDATSRRTPSSGRPAGMCSSTAIAKSPLTAYVLMTATMSMARTGSQRLHDIAEGGRIHVPVAEHLTSKSG